MMHYVRESFSQTYLKACKLSGAGLLHSIGKEEKHSIRTSKHYINEKC